MEWKLFKMSCKRCGHKYQYQGKKYEMESCPVCGYCADFEEFIDEEKDGK